MNLQNNNGKPDESVRDSLNPSVHTDSKNGKIRKSRKSKAAKIILIVVCILLALIIAVSATLTVFYFKGKSHFRNSDISILAPEDAVVQNDDGSQIEYKKEQYIYNENIASILLIGVDRHELEEESSVGSNGQADALYLVVLDTEKKTADVLSVSRDTLALIDKYSPSGKYIGQDTDFICRSYAYGDGREKSCNNVISAVERVLYNVPIHSYVAIDMEAIARLTDAVGGVTVPKYSDDLMTKTDEFTELTSKNALRYIRERSHYNAEANNARIERQKYFIDAFSKKFIEQTKNDLGVPLAVYNTLSDGGYMITDVDISQVTYLAKNFITGISGVTMHSVPGTVTTTEPDENGNTYAQFHIDNDALYDIILDLFYVKKGE